MKNIIICKEFTFDSAHQLEYSTGQCKSMHGHTFRLQICIKGAVKEDGFVLELEEVKKNVLHRVIEILDHKYLNDVIKNPSVENVTIWIWEQLEDVLPLNEIKLWQTPTIYAIYSGQ